MSVTLKPLPRPDDGVHVDIRITADLNVSAYVAQRQVTAYLVDNVSDHLSGEPQPDPALGQYASLSRLAEFSASRPQRAGGSRESRPANEHLRRAR